MKEKWMKVAAYNTGLKPLEVAKLNNCNFEQRIKLERDIFNEIAAKCEFPKQLPAFSKNQTKIFILEHIKRN